MAADWFYAVNGQEAGPVDLQTLQQMLAMGTVAATDYVRGPAQPQWTPAGQIPSLMPQNPAGAVAQPAYGGDSSLLAYRGVETGATGLSQAALTSLSQTKPWVRFVAVMIFIGAGFMVIAAAFMLVAGAAIGSRAGPPGAAVGALSGVYIILAVIYVIPGVFLNRFANNIGSLMRTQRMSDVEAALAAQKSFWKVVGVMIITVISLYLVGIAVFVAIGSRM